MASPQGGLRSALRPKATKAPHARIEFVSYVALAARPSVLKETKDTDAQRKTVSFVALAETQISTRSKSRIARLAQSINVGKHHLPVPFLHRHPGLDPGSMTSAPPWIPDQVRGDDAGEVVVLNLLRRREQPTSGSRSAVAVLVAKSAIDGILRCLELAIEAWVNGTNKAARSAVEAFYRVVEICQHALPLTCKPMHNFCIARFARLGGKRTNVKPIRSARPKPSQSFPNISRNDLRSQGR